MDKISAGTVARTAVLALALVNQVLTVTGHNVINVSNDDINTLVSTGFTIAAAVTAWWKNNSFSKEAIAADRLMKKLKEGDVNADYGIPYSAYIVGMLYNVELFKQAGLVDENGRPIYPTNFEELKNTAITIKEKTGKAGFSFPTVDNQGGWMLMSMAWSFGVDFMEQIDGKWTATFDSTEMVNLMQYISDLKWKYDVLPENVLLSRNDEYQLFATNQTASMYAAGDWANGMISAYGMSKDNISNAPVPAGDGGACSLIGGDIWMISPDTTPEQIDAIFKWLDPSMTIPLIVFTMTWAAFGSTTLVYLASLQSIDHSLYEAAEIDGAGFFGKIRYVTFPHVSGMLRMLLLLQIMGVFKVFQEPLAMTGGGPNNASTSIMLTAYNYAFSYMQVGRSTALGMIIAVILCGFSIVYFKMPSEKKQR